MALNLTERFDLVHPSDFADDQDDPYSGCLWL
jgi:hypothetical protein